MTRLYLEKREERESGHILGQGGLANQQVCQAVGTMPSHYLVACIAETISHTH